MKRQIYLEQRLERSNGFGRGDKNFVNYLNSLRYPKASSSRDFSGVNVVGPIMKYLKKIGNAIKYVIESTEEK